jgi:hypothetical protein
MLVLIATDSLHGATPHDHQHAVDGELVSPVILECPDARCEYCRRAWVGLVSHGGTTTAMVVDRPGVTEAILRERLHGWLDCQGTVDQVVQAVEAGEYEVDGVPVDDAVVAVDELITDHVREIEAICERFGVGTMVSRMGQLVAERVTAEAA